MVMMSSAYPERLCGVVSREVPVPVVGVAGTVIKPQLTRRERQERLQAYTSHAQIESMKSSIWWNINHGRTPRHVQGRKRRSKAGGWVEVGVGVEVGVEVEVEVQV